MEKAIIGITLIAWAIGLIALYLAYRGQKRKQHSS